MTDIYEVPDVLDHRKIVVYGYGHTVRYHGKLAALRELVYPEKRDQWGPIVSLLGSAFREAHHDFLVQHRVLNHSEQVEAPDRPTHNLELSQT